jgi:hypothetical protein
MVSAAAMTTRRCAFMRGSVTELRFKLIGLSLRSGPGG